MKHSLQLKLGQHLTLTPQLQQSIRLLQLSTLELNQELEQMLQDNPLLEREDEDDTGLAAAEAPAPAADALGVALVEGWRGEVCHVALTDAAGKFRRYKITDPSFHNWPGLALALRGAAISDFPICNKSFSLSYCGFDL